MAELDLDNRDPNDINNHLKVKYGNIAFDGLLFV